jgi:hypothetical protein
VMVNSIGAVSSQIALAAQAQVRRLIIPSYCSP